MTSGVLTRDGKVLVPGGPGLGVEYGWEFIEHHETARHVLSGARPGRAHVIFPGSDPSTADALASRQLAHPRSGGPGSSSVPRSS